MGNQQKWTEAIKAKGHTPVMDDGELEYFVMDAGFHNGPGCQTCGWSCCWHCDGIEDIPECTKPALELTATEVRALPEP